MFMGQRVAPSLSISLSLYTFLAILLSLCRISVPLKVPEYVAPTNAQKKDRSHFWTICNVVPGDVGSCSVDALSSIANNLTTWASQ
jgi:hypothetical protein